MARKQRRPRRYLPHWLVVMLPFVGFRYDGGRYAYILRRIGDDRGPVIRDARLRGRLVRLPAKGEEDGESAAEATDELSAGAQIAAPAAAVDAGGDGAPSQGTAGVGPPGDGMTTEPGWNPAWGGSSPPPRRRRRRWPWVLVGVAAIVVWLGFVAASLLRAAQDASNAQSAANAARAQLTNAGSGVLSSQSTASLQLANQRAAALDRDLSNPALTPLQILPWVGTQVRSARALATSANKGSAAGVTALNEANAALAQPHGPGPGRILLLQRLAGIAATASRSLRSLDTGPSSGLIGPLSSRHSQLAGDISRAQDGLYRSAAASQAAANLLGSPHQYLVLAANNAEMRAGSGIFLQAGILTTGGGHMEMGPMQSVGQRTVPPPGITLPPDLAARWGLLLPGEFIQNLAVTPQFDVVGPIAAQMWQAKTGQHIDGVIAVDVEGLHQILNAIGPVNADGTEVTADNVVNLIMHDQYIGLNGSGEDAGRREILGALARAAFDTANSGSSDLTKLATGLARGANGRHVLVWSDQPNIQTLWQQAGAAGQLQSQDLMPTVINLGTNKLDYYLDVVNSLVVRPGSGQTDLTLHVHLTNRTPPGQSTYIAGPSSPIGLGVPTSQQPYGQYTGIVAVNLPAGATAATINGSANPPVKGPEGPTSVLATQISLAAGQSQDVTVQFRMPGDHGQVRVLPSARVPAVSWTGQRSFTETGANTVSW